MGEQLYEELNVKDEEPAPKRTHVSKTLILGEETLEPSYWDRLPYTATIQVYSYLNDSDRVAMARVCQAWYMGFKDPSLWRSREFNFGGSDGQQKCEKMIRFASKFGKYLKDVVIRFPRRTKNSYKYITEMTEILMAKLEKARLCRLKLLDLESDFFNISLTFKDTLGRCLVKLLKSQTALKHVMLMNCQLYDKPGTEVLKVLQNFSGQTLESLQLIEFFQIWSRYFEEDLIKSKVLYTDLEKFTNLREIVCHYSYISEEIIQRWTVDLKNKLQNMTLLVVDYELVNSNLITSRTWRNLTTACPQLKVDLDIYHALFEIDVIELLEPGMPLNCFFMMSKMEKEQELELASILTHLADNFDQELESFKIVLPHLQDSVDNEIVRVVETCRKLTTIRVPSSAAFGVATALCNDFKERQARNVQLQIGRSEDKETSHQDIVKNVNDMISEFPNLTVEWDVDY